MAAAGICGRRADVLYRDETEALLASIGLLDQAETSRASCRTANQKQLELGIALASDPRILLLDEPTAGMSATETRETDPPAGADRRASAR